MPIMKPIRIIIAGGRDFSDYKLLEDSVMQWIADFHGFDYEQVAVLTGLTGAAKGADALGVKFAQKYFIEDIAFPADWNKHGKAAGPIRNTEMARSATHCICFWDCESKGTRDMIRKAKNAGLKLKVVFYSLQTAVQ